MSKATQRYSVRELSKLKNQKEDNKLKLNPHATSYVLVKMSNNEEMYNLLIYIIQQQIQPLCRSIQRSSIEMDSRTKGKAAGTIEIYNGTGS